MKSKSLLATTMALVLLCAFSLSSAVTAQQAGKGGTEAQDSAKKAADRRERVINRLWWNQEKKLEKLQLSTDTRKQMDDLARAFIAERNELLSDGLFESFSAALESGNWKKAEKEADHHAEVTAKITRAKMQMMIDVLQLVPEETLASLKEEYPMLLRRDWIPGFGSSMGPRGRGPRR